LICICGWNIVAGTTSYEIENYNSLPPRATWQKSEKNFKKLEKSSKSEKNLRSKEAKRL
jgi:hypothetical protein